MKEIDFIHIGNPEIVKDVTILKKHVCEHMSLKMKMKKIKARSE